MNLYKWQIKILSGMPFNEHQAIVLVLKTLITWFIKLNLLLIIIE